MSARVNSSGKPKSKITHKIIEEIYSCDGSITFPSALMAFEVLKVVRIDATVIQSVDVAMCFPGQTLCRNHWYMREKEFKRVTNLRPKPKAASGSRMSLSNFPSFKKRSGLKTEGSGYSSLSRRIALVSTN
jgi:hypothetical protein